MNLYQRLRMDERDWDLREKMEWQRPSRGIVLGLVATAITAALLGFMLGARSDVSHTDTTRTLHADARGSQMTLPGRHISLSDDLLSDKTLTEEQCHDFFPLQKDELAPTSEWTRKNGGVSIHDVDAITPGAHARVVIKAGRAYLKHYRGAWHSRALAVLQSLQEAIQGARESMPDVEFTMGLDDSASPNKAMFSLARRMEEPGWLVPDFGFYSWPEPQIRAWSTFRREIDRVNNDLTWQSKKPQLFWRGVLLSEWRHNLVDTASAHPEWNNVRGIDWGKLDLEPRVSMPEHARYQYVAMTEGGDSYSGRLKYLLSAQSVVVSHPLRWQQHWHRALDGRNDSATQNIVFVEGPGWQGLEQTMDALLRDPARSRLIARNAYETFHRRYTSPAAVACWWRSVLKAYAGCLNFDPELDSHTKDIESVLLMQSTEWDPHR